MKPFIFHPGEFLLDELEARNRSQSFFAELIGKTRQEVNHLITGRRSVNAERALRISAALGTEPQFWLNLQNSYDIKTLETTKEAPQFEKIREKARELVLA
nr:MAG TPA: Plasmid maintenance system antidote protein [Caudoviricetes sp.]